MELTRTEETAASYRRLTWQAEGAATATAALRLFRRDGQRHLAELELEVEPDARRRGLGSQLLAEAVREARADGRRTLMAEARADSPGAAFLAARGFRTVLRLTYARLPLPLQDPARLDVPAAPGYRLTSWDGTVPDDLAATFAASRRAMDDMPMDDADYGHVEWDVARVREAARTVAARGDHLHTVAAVHEATGEIAGFTELVVPGDGKGNGQHYGTGVLPGHRGHGLGLWMKAEAIRAAAARHPDLGGLLTDTAASNAPMRRVNDALGYAPTHTALTCQLDL